MSLPTNQTILSGIQPSGSLHLGNYLGALKQWVELQQTNTCFYCIVDLHAITVDYDPAQLQEKILDTAALYLAAGLDPDKSTLFIQSHVSAHTELAWLLATQTPYGELTRMIQFKEKSQKQTTQPLETLIPTEAKTGPSVGLFSYPILQAADILLYQPNLIPIGEDQIQHIELTRDIAKRFNNKFGPVFTLPQPHINKSSARIMSLTDPTKKMSKSDADKSYIALTDQPEIIKKKIMSAVTETEFNIKSDSPSIKNLLTIHQALSDHPPTATNYKGFKEALANLIIDKLSPLQEKYKKLRQHDDELRVMLAAGAVKAQIVANQTLQAVKQKMGLV